MKAWQAALSLMLLSLVLVAGSANAYHFFYVADGIAARWQTTGVPFVSDTDGPAGQTFTALCTTATGTWNAVPDALDIFATPATSAVNFTGANFGTAWGRLTGDGQNELVYDADGSALIAMGLDPASINGFGPTRQRLVGGQGVIDDAFFVVTGTRTNFDLLSTLIHELGHIQGLAHSSVGMHTSSTPEAALDKIALNSVPTMHPFSLGTGNISRRTLEVDDQAALRDLYPEAGAATRWASVSGEVRRCGSNDVVVGANVRLISTANASVQISRFSAFDGNGTGRYTMNLVPAGSYRVVVEPLGANGFTLNRFGSPPSTAENDFDFEFLSPAAVELPCLEELPETTSNIVTVTAANGGTASGNNFRVGAPSLAFVVDDTGSMGNEIASVRTILNQTIQALELASVVTPFPLTAIVTFKDDVTKRIVSNNPANLRTVVNSLFASGGGDCPEAGNAALLVGGRLLRKNGVALLFTDADSRADGPSRSSVESLYLSKGVRLFTLLSGSCSGAITSDSNAPQAAPITPESLLEDGQPTLLATTNSAAMPAGASTEEFLPEPIHGFEPGVTTFSNISNSTGGFFVAIPGIKFGDPAEITRYNNTGTNLAISAVLPALALATPTSTPAGATLNVEISGSNTNFIAGQSSLSFSGSGITVNSLAVNSPTRLTASLSIAPTAALGFRDALIATNLGGGTMEQARGFGLISVTAAPVAPTTLSVTPSLARQGQTLDVQINAAAVNFTSASTANFGTGITVIANQLINSSTLQARIQIAPNATIGYRRVFVATPGVGTAIDNSPTGAFQVTAPGPIVPVIQMVAPSQVPRASVQDIVISAVNTNFSAATQLTFSGSGISVTSLSAPSATTLNARITIAADAAPGFRDVFATTAGATAARLNGIQVTAALAVLGDVNGDGSVNCVDLGIVKAALGSVSGQATFDPRADVVRDGRIDIRDLSFVAQRVPAGTRCE